MTNLDAIKSWLSNPADYNAGLSLYNANKINTKMDKFFASGDDQTRCNILRQKLIGIANKLQANPRLVKNMGSVPESISKSVVRKTPQISINNRQSTISNQQSTISNQQFYPKTRIWDLPADVHINDLPPHLQTKFREAKKLYKEQTRLHSEMSNAIDDDNRKQFRDDLLNVQNTLIDNWKAIDDYLANPVLSDDDIKLSDNDIKSGADMQKRITLLKEYIRRDNKKIGTLKNGRKIENAKNRVENYERELKILQSAIG